MALFELRACRTSAVDFIKNGFPHSKVASGTFQPNWKLSTANSTQGYAANLVKPPTLSAWQYTRQTCKRQMAEMADKRIFEPDCEWLEPVPFETEVLQRASMLCDLRRGKSEQDFAAALQAKVTESSESHDRVALGLLHSILTSDTYEAADAHFSLLNGVTRDDFQFITHTILSLAQHRQFRLLNNEAITQLVWIVERLIRHNPKHLELVLIAILRQIPELDIPERQLTARFLDMLERNRLYLDRHPQLISASVYVYLRIIPYYCNRDNLGSLIDFCNYWLRHRFLVCTSVGRDIVRALASVAHIPAFAELWHTISTDPTSLDPNFTGIPQILAKSTDRYMFPMVISPDMEAKLKHIMTQLKMHNFHWNLKFFCDQFVVPNGGRLVADIVRYICGFYHPPNAVLRSDIVPRWTMISVLLDQVYSSEHRREAQLALFYDWLFWQPAEENLIMNIEPALLTLVRSSSISRNWVPDVLIDFLHFVMSEYLPSMRGDIALSVEAAIGLMLRMGVARPEELVRLKPTIAPDVQKAFKAIFGPHLHALRSARHTTREISLAASPVSLGHPSTQQMQSLAAFSPAGPSPAQATLAMDHRDVARIAQSSAVRPANDMSPILSESPAPSSHRVAVEEIIAGSPVGTQHANDGGPEWCSDDAAPAAAGHQPEIMGDSSGESLASLEADQTLSQLLADFKRAASEVNAAYENILVYEGTQQCQARDDLNMLKTRLIFAERLAGEKLVDILEEAEEKGVSLQPLAKSVADCFYAWAMRPPPFRDLRFLTTFRDHVSAQFLQGAKNAMEHLFAETYHEHCSLQILPEQKRNVKLVSELASRTRGSIGGRWLCFVIQQHSATWISAVRSSGPIPSWPDTSPYQEICGQNLDDIVHRDLKHLYYYALEYFLAVVPVAFRSLGCEGNEEMIKMMIRVMDPPLEKVMVDQLKSRNIRVFVDVDVLLNILVATTNWTQVEHSYGWRLALAEFEGNDQAVFDVVTRLGRTLLTEADPFTLGVLTLLVTVRPTRALVLSFLHICGGLHALAVAFEYWKREDGPALAAAIAEIEADPRVGTTEKQLLHEWRNAMQ